MIIAHTARALHHVVPIPKNHERALIYPEVVDLIERFQTVLVGAVGFIGVIWTLRTNAKLASVERQQQIQTRRSALRRVLAAELRNYSHALKGNLDAGAPDDQAFSVGRIRTLFSQGLAAEIGLLELGEVDVVVNALISLDGMEHFLQNLSASHDERRFLIPSAAWGEYRTAASTTANALDLAVQALELSGEA